MSGNRVMTPTRGAKRGVRAPSETRERAESARREGGRAARSRAVSLAEATSVLGIVAHDLRNPLSTITMASDLLLEGIPGDRPEEQRRYLEIIRRAVTGMSHLIDNLLDARQLESGELPVDPRSESGAALLANAADLLRPLVESRGLRLELDVGERLPELHVDPDRILQVLSNLVGNAVKFTPSGGTVTIRARYPGEDALCVSVVDTGIGMSPEELPHVFGRFWQGDRRDRRGIGPGLAIVEGIVEAHGGRIWVESRAGAGSEFHFTLPVAGPAGAGDPSTP
jgi:signal transduction histidine kinase